MDLDLKSKIISHRIGFFPYCSGLLNIDVDELPKKCLMIVGQDYGTVDLIKNGDKNQTTLTNTKSLIKDYPQEKLFLTNLFLGLRKEKSMIGINPSLKNKETSYLGSCFKYFKIQVASTQPKHIIILGKVPYNFICDMYNKPEFKVQSFLKYYSKIDLNGFFKIDNINVLCIPHPSMLNSNVKNKDELINRINNFIT
ncbi:MAG: uracil-DNA glycosylase family protein [Bacteroidota bacterium]